MSLFKATTEWPYAVSSGGLVYKIVDEKRYYALLYRGERFGKIGNSWHLPKGHLEDNETLQQAALREIEEESGLKVEIEKYLGALNYIFFHERKEIHNDKIMHYFLCEYIGEIQSMDKEHDSVEWMEAKEAIAKLSKVPKNEETIIRRAEQAFECE